MDWTQFRTVTLDEARRPQYVDANGSMRHFAEMDPSKRINDAAVFGAGTHDIHSLGRE